MEKKLNLEIRISNLAVTSLARSRYITPFLGKIYSNCRRTFRVRQTF